MANNIVDNELIKAEFQDGVSQVDENLVITEFSSVFENETRKLKAVCKIAHKETDETFELTNELG